MDHGICTSRPRGFPVEKELDEFIPPLTMQLLHSWTTFSGDLHTSLLQQTGLRNLRLNIHFCSKSSNSIFAISIGTHIPFRHLAAIFLSPPNNYFLPSFLRDLQHKGILYSDCHSSLLKTFRYLGSCSFIFL